MNTASKYVDGITRWFSSLLMAGQSRAGLHCLPLKVFLIISCVFSEDDTASMEAHGIRFYHFLSCILSSSDVLLNHSDDLISVIWMGVSFCNFSDFSDFRSFG